MGGRKAVGLTMPPSLLGQIDLYRRANGDMSRSAVIRKAVEFFLAAGTKKSLSGGGGTDKRLVTK